MARRPKGSSYPMKFPCGCAAGYQTRAKGKKKIAKSPDVLILKGFKDGRRVCSQHGRVWRLESEWVEVRDE